MKARTRNAARLAKLNRRVDTWPRRYKRKVRGGWNPAKDKSLGDEFIGKNHHEPVHEAKQRPTQSRKPAQRPQQVPDMLPDFSILAIAAQAKRKRAVR